MQGPVLKPASHIQVLFKLSHIQYAGFCDRVEISPVINVNEVVSLFEFRVKVLLALYVFLYFLVARVPAVAPGAASHRAIARCSVEAVTLIVDALVLVSSREVVLASSTFQIRVLRECYYLCRCITHVWRFKAVARVRG